MEIYTDTTPDRLRWWDPLRRNVFETESICARDPNAASRGALDQMRRGEMNEYGSVDGMRCQVLDVE